MRRRSSCSGHVLWTQQFASDRSILGRPLRIDGKTYSVIGVMPPDFRFPAPYWAGGDLWLLRNVNDASLPELARQDAARVRASA